MERIKHFIRFTIWDLGMRYGNIMPIFILKHIHKCSLDAQIYQRLYGGSLVYAIKNIQEPSQVCDHFMNLINGHIIDLNGNHWVGGINIGDKGDFGNGTYTIINIVDKFADFGIHSVAELIETTKRLHAELDLNNS